MLGLIIIAMAAMVAMSLSCLLKKEWSYAWLWFMLPGHMIAVWLGGGGWGSILAMLTWWAILLISPRFIKD